MKKKASYQNNIDIRISIEDIINDNELTDIILVNTPSRWINIDKGLFDLPNLHLESSSNNSKRLFGDQDHEPNHGLLMIASYLRENGIKFKLIDLQTLYYLNYNKTINIDVEDYFYKTIESCKPTIVAFSSMTPSINIAIEYSTKLKMKYGLNITTIIGGLATIELEKCLNAFDIVIKGEGEYTCLELFKSILSKRSYSNLDGIAFKNGSTFIDNKSVEPVGQPNLLPAYDLLPIELELIPRIYTSRGCINQCSFCSPSIFFGERAIIRSANDVIDDIKSIHSKYEFDWFLIGDLTLYFKNKEVQKVCKFINNKEHKKWWCQTQVSQLEEKYIELISKSNCTQVALGFEDFETEDIQIRRKNPNKKNAKYICNLLRSNGIKVQGYWIFGTPEDTFESCLRRIEDICEFIKEDLVDTIHISFLIPYPNSLNIHKDNIYSSLILSDMNYSKYLDISTGFYNQLPLHSTKYLSSKEIFLITQLATSCSANEFYFKTVQNRISKNQKS